MTIQCLCRDADNFILREEEWGDITPPTPKAGLKWKALVVSGSGPVREQVFTDTQVLRTFRAMNAGETTAARAEIGASEIGKPIGKVARKLLNAGFMQWRVANPTGTRTQYINAILAFEADTSPPVGQRAFTEQQVADLIASLLS